jgi:hypothetical protein
MFIRLIKDPILIQSNPIHIRTLLISDKFMLLHPLSLGLSGCPFSSGVAYEPPQQVTFPAVRDHQHSVRRRALQGSGLRANVNDYAATRLMEEWDG